MSIAQFQRALSDMTLDPVLAAGVLRRGDERLAGYELTDLERRRLVALARQPGMSVNCTLARANRFAPIADAFPLTCSLLKPVLRPLVDELWSVYRPGTYQLSGEAEAFQKFLTEKISRSELNHPYADEVFGYECVAWGLIQTLRHVDPARGTVGEKAATVRFTHDPRILVPCLERDELPPPDLPSGEYRVRLTLHGDTLDVTTEG